MPSFAPSAASQALTTAVCIMASLSRGMTLAGLLVIACEIHT
jgi:hypothetical protein